MKHLVADPLDRLGRVGEGGDLETFGGQEVLQVLQDVLIVVDDEDGQLGRHFDRSCRYHSVTLPKSLAENTDGDR